MKKMRKGCHALIVALVMAIFCNFIAFGDEVAEPAESAVESVMDDAADNSSVSESTDSEADETAEPDSDVEPDGSEAEEAPEPEDKNDDDQSFDSGKKEDHSSFDEWDFPAPTPEPEKPTPEPEKPEIPVTPEPEKPVPEPEKPEPQPEIPVVPVTPEPAPEPVAPVVPEPTPQPEPTPEHWHDDDDDDDDIVVIIPKKPVVATKTDEVPVVKTFEVSSGDTLPTPEDTPTVKTEIPETPSSDLPKTGDSSLALYAFMASAFGLVVLMASSFIGRHNADETAKEVPAYPQMCCGPQETKETGKDVSVKAARSSGTKIAPSRFGLRCKSCIEIVLALTHPGWGLFVSKSR